MLTLAKDQRKFGQYGVGIKTAECLISTVKKASLFHFDFTEDERKRFLDIEGEIWVLGYHF